MRSCSTGRGIVVHNRLGLRLALVTLAFVVGQASTGHATTFSDLYVFGASQSDTGNNGPIDASPVLPASFGYDPDRWTNAGGTMWVETLAAGLGLASATVASSDGGNNYAVGGNRADQVVSEQIPAFSAAVGGSAPSTALYVVWSGGNDFLQGQSAASTVTDVTDIILGLSGLGAENFLVLNMPDFSPLAPGGGPLGGTVPIPPGADIWANDFNTGLSASLASLTGVTIYEYDAASLINAIFADPVGNGFSQGLALCADDIDCINGIAVDDFVMMDHVHIASPVQQLIGAGALTAVPEPSTGLLLGLGLLGLGFAREVKA